MRPNWMKEAIRKIDHALMVILVICLLLGVVGFILDFVLHGYIGQGHGSDY